MNYTRKIAELQRRVDEQEQTLAQVSVSLRAHAVADHVLLRALASRFLADQESWRAVIDDLASAAISELTTLPIVDEPAAAEIIRSFAHGLLSGALNTLEDIKKRPIVKPWWMPGGGEHEPTPPWAQRLSSDLQNPLRLPTASAPAAPRPGDNGAPLNVHVTNQVDTRVSNTRDLVHGLGADPTIDASGAMLGAIP